MQHETVLPKILEDNRASSIRRNLGPLGHNNYVFIAMQKKNPSQASHKQTQPRDHINLNCARFINTRLNELDAPCGQWISGIWKINLLNYSPRTISF